jgi:hypothetical protein
MVEMSHPIYLELFNLTKSLIESVIT